VSLLKDIPEEAVVYRTSSLESRILMMTVPRLLGINGKYVQVPDPFVGWLPAAVVKGLHIIKKEKIDAVFSTSMPNTSHLAALLLTKKTGIPWLADFREAWTDNPFVVYPRIVRSLEEKMEKAVIENADAVTVINDFIRKGLAAKYPEQADKMITVSHGFDSEDFASIVKEPSATFTIVYAGSLYGRRSPDVFLKAVKDLTESDSNVRDTMRIQFVGNVDAVKPMVDQLQIADVVSVCGYLSHVDVHALMVHADVLLLIIGAGKDDSTISTGKLFDYIGSGTPILALVPEGAAADVVRSTHTGVVVHPHDTEGMKKAVYNFYEAHKKREVHNLRQDLVSRYDVRHLSQQVSDVLNSIVGT
jgi:glycosyltransferase involved in cell wall biosynthesis